MVDEMLNKSRMIRLRVSRKPLAPCRLKAFYATLLQINQAIVRATSMAELYQETCRITSQFGCFDLAWIACPLPHSFEVRVAAASGPFAEYAQGITLSLDPGSSVPKGPVNACFREGRPVVTHDWFQESGCLPWQVKGRQYGFHSNAAFPIFRGGQVAAALVLYSREKKFFSPGRVELLEAVCGNISATLGRLASEDQERAAASVQRATEARHLEEIQQLNGDLELRVRERTLQLEELNRELTSFVNSISHDLRAPLRHIEGFAGLLARCLGDQLEPKAGHYLDVIQGASRRMAKLIDEILAYSRLGRSELHRIPLELNRVVQDLIDQLQADVGRRRVRWVLGPLPPLDGDPSLIGFLFQNLLDNALKFTRPRAEAVIEILPLEPGPDGPRLGFRVRDNGVGFDQAHAGKLFTLFQRLHREDQFEGTGVGLANALRIVTRHGGHIRGDGKVDQGASFEVTFPNSPT